MAPFDIILEIICGAALLGLWVYTLITFSSLPEIIPIHFDFQGHVDGTGSRGVVWLLPTIGSVIYVLLALVGNYPHTFNYPVSITPENAKRQYTIALRMMRTLRLSITLLMFLIQVMMVLTAVGTLAEPPGWIIVAGLALVFAPIAYYLTRAFREK